MSDLELAGVSKVYRTKGRPEVDAVRGFDLSVRSGELVGLLGPSGCGKSTTLRMVAGLEDVSGGDIRVGSGSVVGLRPQERNIGVAFENYALYPPLTVRENIAFGLDARGYGAASERKGRVDDIADRIGLGEIMNARPAGLSSGQKQRVALARAIARRPDVLLLDEPLSHLDAGQRDVTRRELRRLQRELGYTTVLVTHDQEEALSLADRVVVMNEGEVQQVGSPDEVYDEPANLFVAGFVGEPAMNLLSGSLDGDAVVLGEQVRVPLSSGGRSSRDKQAFVVLGVRPEDLGLTAGAAGDMQAEVVVVEDLLEYALVTLALPGVTERLVAQTTVSPGVQPGDQVGLAFERKRTFVFAEQGGERLR